MKPNLLNMFRNGSIIVSLLFNSYVNAQQPSLGILNIDGKGILIDDESLGTMVRIEAEKLNRYDILDWHDIREKLSKSDIIMDSCFSRSCIQKSGNILHADKMIFGSVERIGEHIVIVLRMMDVTTGTIDKSSTMEYQNFQKDLQIMMEVSVKKLMGIEPDPKLVTAVSVENEIYDAHYTKVNLSGPRLGCYMTTGIAGERMRADKQPHGGLGMYPVSSIIGWQQEVQYLSSGNFQALFEFLFTGAGLESGRFIPAFTVMNGFRLNREGWEVAFGPTFRVVRKADGFYKSDENGNFDAVEDWYLEDEWDQSQGPNPYPIVSNLDDRGDPKFTGGLLIAVGKTFTSGSLNIPVNLYCIPRKEGTTYGLAFGFNMFKSKKNR